MVQFEYLVLKTAKDYIRIISDTVTIGQNYKIFELSMIKGFFLRKMHPCLIFRSYDTYV